MFPVNKYIIYYIPVYYETQSDFYLHLSEVLMKVARAVVKD